MMIVLLMGVLAAAAPLDTAKIEQLTGMKGTLSAKEGVFKVSFPRSDLNVTAGGVHLTPPMGLTAWAAFTKAGAHVAVMGDMVLSEDQINPAMSAALDNGLEVTATTTSPGRNRESCSCTSAEWGTRQRSPRASATCSPSPAATRARWWTATSPCSRANCRACSRLCGTRGSTSSPSTST